MEMENCTFKPNIKRLKINNYKEDKISNVSKLEKYVFDTRYIDLNDN